jgi:O-antigen ligase
VSEELARLAGAVAAVGLAALVLAPGGRLRLAGLGLAAIGGGGLSAYIAPSGDEALLAAGAVAAILVAAALAPLFVRWPWLVPVGALALAPVRVPVEVGDTEANLLLPLYGLLLSAGFALAWQLLRGDDRTRELGPLAWPLAAFVAWSGVSLLWTDDVREGAISFAAFYLPFTLLAVFVARLPWSRRWVAALGVELVGLGLVFAGIGVYQWLTRDVFWNPKVIVGNAYAPFFRVNSVFWDPSIYGRFLVVAILVALVLVLYGAARRTALVAGAAIALLWAGLVLSFSQSSFVALMVGVVAAAALAWRRRAIAVLAVASALLLTLGFAAPQVRSAILEDTETGLDKATSGRSKLLTEGAGLAADHPLAGVGHGSFKDAYAARVGLRGEDPGRAASHNTPVTVAAELGVPGILLFGWLVLTALVLPFRRASWSFSGRASLAFGLGLLAILVHSLFYDALFEDPFTWALLGLIALAYAWRTSTRAMRARSAGR